MADMTNDEFAVQSFGKAAMAKMGNVSNNFRLYHASWLTGQRDVMSVTGAEFRVAKSGPNKGLLSIKIPGTEKRVFVTAEEIEKYT
jgi:hypothetical protein